MSNCYSTQQLADAFKALAHPYRLQIYQQLLNCCQPGNRCSFETISKLGENLNIAASTLSHHIRELQQAGLINTRRNGKFIECYVDNDHLQMLSRFFTDFASSSNQRNP